MRKQLDTNELSVIYLCLNPLSNNPRDGIITEYLLPYVAGKSY